MALRMKRRNEQGGVGEGAAVQMCLQMAGIIAADGLHFHAFLCRRRDYVQHLLTTNDLTGRPGTATWDV